MSIYSEIKQAFPTMPIADISDYYTTEIELAKNVYQGKPPWDSVTSSGLKTHKRPRALTGTAKVVCDKMAALTYSEQCVIKCDAYQELIDETLEINAFSAKFPEWLSRAFALGGGVIKVRPGARPTLDYLNADVFFPTKWDNRHITGAVFRNKVTAGKNFYTLFENVNMTASGLVVEQALFKSDTRDNLGIPSDIKEIYPEAEATVGYNGIRSPLFAYFKPAIGNNKCFDLPLGLPIFANCYDTLEEVDVVFDSLQREFVLGKKRIIVPEAFVKTVYDEDGKDRKYFDDNDEVYQAFFGDDGQLKITDISTELRIQQHIDALNFLLDMLASQLGLSVGSLSFDKAEGLKTATEVVSNERDTMRTVENQKNILAECIKELCENIIAADCYMKGVQPTDHEITVTWNDNIIADDDTRIQRNIELVNAGLRSKLRALAEINGYSEEDARKELDAINSEQPAGGGSLDSLFGDGER